MAGHSDSEYQVEWHDKVPTITTQRLVLRIAGGSDVDALLEFHGRNLEHFQPWMPDTALRPTRESLTIATQDRFDQAWNDKGYRFHLFPKDDLRRIVGLCSIADIRRGVIQQCVLGYAIDRDCQGQGLMREAVAAAVRFAFEELDLHRIEGSYMPDNAASAAILSSLGFEQQGFFKDYLLLDGKWQDHVVTFLVNQNWKGTGRSVS